MRFGKAEKKICRCRRYAGGSVRGVSVYGIEGNSSVRICGCREIISYGSEKAEIAVTGMNVTVCGENLMIETFGGGTVRLSGVIGSVSLSDGKGKEKC